MGVKNIVGELRINDKEVATIDDIVIKPGEGENSIQQVGTGAQSLSKASVALGEDSKAGCRGYYIKAVDFGTSTLYLTEVQPNDIITVQRGTSVLSIDSSNVETSLGTIGEDLPLNYMDENFLSNIDTDYGVDDEVSLIIYGFRTETGKVGSFHYNLLTTITAIDNNKITLAINPLPFTSLVPVSADYKWYSSFMVPAKPDIGAVELMVNATALGDSTIAAGEASVAEGFGTIAVGAYGHAEGRDTTAVYAAHSEGANTQALAMTAHAEGEGTVASGVRSHAQGYYTIAAGNQQQVWGKFNKADTENKYAHIVGGGTHFTEDKRKNIHTLDWSGNAWFAGDITIANDGNELSVIAIANKASSAESEAHAANDNAANALEKAIAVDVKATAAAETASIVYRRPGSITIVNGENRGDAMNREGVNVASGTRSFATGYHSEATKDTAIAMGNIAIADADYAVAIGQAAKSHGIGSVSIGYGNIVETTATSSFVTGWNSTIAGRHSAAIGNYAQTLHENQIALGTYNDAQNADDIFMVGNGSSALRKNVFVVKKDGTGYLGDKKILVEGDVTSSDEIDVKLNGTLSPTAIIMQTYPNVLSSGVEIYENIEDAGKIYLSNTTWGTGITLSGTGYALFGTTDNFGSSVQINGFGGTITADNSITAAEYITASAGITEMYEWIDGNANDEDRRGLFITLDGGKIRVANETDTYILGIIDPNPSLIGDAAGLEWKNKYLKDIFGSYIYEEVEVPATYDEEGNILTEATTRKQKVLNPDYDETLEYVSRTDRKEFAAITSKGKVVMIDDGTCISNGYATVGANG